MTGMDLDRLWRPIAVSAVVIVANTLSCSNKDGVVDDSLSVTPDNIGCSDYSEEDFNDFFQVSVHYGRPSDAGAAVGVVADDGGEGGLTPPPPADLPPAHILITLVANGGLSNRGFSGTTTTIANPSPTSALVNLVDATPSSSPPISPISTSSIDLAIDVARDALSFDVNIDKISCDSYSTISAQTTLNFNITLDDGVVTWMTAAIGNGTFSPVTPSP